MVLISVLPYWSCPDFSLPRSCSFSSVQSALGSFYDPELGREPNGLGRECGRQDWGQFFSLLFNKLITFSSTFLVWFHKHLRLLISASPLPFLYLLIFYVRWGWGVVRDEVLLCSLGWPLNSQSYCLGLQGWNYKVSTPVLLVCLNYRI